LNSSFSVDAERRLGSSPASKRTRTYALILPALAATALLGAAAPAFSQVGIDIEIAPPAPRVLIAPPPRPGFIWAPGYWQWDGHRHIWMDGRWMRARPGWHWVPERWVPHGRRYRFMPGHWARG
jgi:hypothetical protein